MMPKASRAIMLLLPLLPFAATAEETGTEPPAWEQTAQIPVPSDEVARFAQAYRRVQAIRGHAVLEIAQAPKQAEFLRAEANAAMRRAVEEDGLSVNRFDELVIAMQADRALRSRVQELMNGQEVQP